MVVTGHFVGGATQQLTFSNPSTTQWQTEQLDWTGLTSVDIHSGASFGGYGDFLSFETTAPTAPVPEPAMATLLLAGLGVLAAKSAASRPEPRRRLPPSPARRVRPDAPFFLRLAEPRASANASPHVAPPSVQWRIATGGHA